MADCSTDDLRAALAGARSWREVLRNLGMPESSSSRLRAVQRQAECLGLDTGHLRGRRTWSDADLVRAVAQGRSWAEVGSRLGLAESGNGVLAGVRRRAARLGLATAHLDAEQTPDRDPWTCSTDVRLLSKAGPMLAAAWFTLCGYDVLWPLEPCRYDLVVSRDGRSDRIQVKTTTHRPGGAAAVSVSNTRRRGRATYTAAEVDHFFVVDDELNCYLIPVDRVAGRHQIHLRGYEAYRVVTAGRLIVAPPVPSG